MTNDGELARKLTDAASHVPKMYLVKVSGQPSREALDKLRGGVMLETVSRRFASHKGAAPGTAPSASCKGGPPSRKGGAPDAAPESALSAAEGSRRRFSAGKKPMRAVRTAPAKIKLLKEGPNPWFEVTLIEGKNRQIRRMFETVGHHVEKIKRVTFGPLMLDVEPGRYRPLTGAEVKALASAAEGKPRRGSNKTIGR
jgi:23S rRNA pseudouridine2605 synthase